MLVNNAVGPFDEVLQYLSESLSDSLVLIEDTYKKRIEEIRLRINNVLTVTLPEGSRFVDKSGTLSSSSDKAVIVTRRALEDSFKYLCNLSVYSFQNQIKNGFITIKGGHRAGVCGTAVIENGKISTIRDITSINLRIAREIKGCSQNIYDSLFKNKIIEGCLIISPPGGGKTTILRDLTRQLSENGKKIAAIDERGELGAVYDGLLQKDLGPLCDVLDGYPKYIGIIQAVRTLSPDAIVCDEIGDEEEANAVFECMKCGVPVILTAHASTINDIRIRAPIYEMLSKNAIKYIVMLNGPENPGTIKRIYKAGEIND